MWWLPTAAIQGIGFSRTPPPHSFGRDYRLTGVNTSRQMHPLTMHRPLSLSLSISHSLATPPPSPELSCQEMRRFCHVRLSISPFNGFVHFLSFSFPFFVGFHSAPVPAGYFHVGYIPSDEVGECRRCESMGAMLRAVWFARNAMSGALGSTSHGRTRPIWQPLLFYWLCDLGQKQGQRSVLSRVYSTSSSPSVLFDSRRMAPSTWVECWSIISENNSFNSIYLLICI